MIGEATQSQCQGIAPSSGDGQAASRCLHSGLKQPQVMGPQVSCPQSCWCSLGMVLLGKSQPPILPQPLCPFSASAAKPGERGEAFSLHCFGEEQHALDYPSAVVPPSASQLSLHTPVRAAWAVTPSWCSSLSGVLLAAARTVKHQTAECNLLRSHEDPDLMVQV